MAEGRSRHKDVYNHCEIWKLYRAIARTCLSIAQWPEKFLYISGLGPRMIAHFSQQADARGSRLQ